MLVVIVGFDASDLIRSGASRINTDSISSCFGAKSRFAGRSVRKTSKIDSFVDCALLLFVCFDCFALRQKSDQAKEGMWGMPGHTEAKKAVVSCDKPGGAAHTLRSLDGRMG